jgi:hypothetical protein
MDAYDDIKEYFSSLEELMKGNEVDLRDMDYNKLGCRTYSAARFRLSSMRDMGYIEYKNNKVKMSGELIKSMIGKK